MPNGEAMSFLIAFWLASLPVPSALPVQSDFQFSNALRILAQIPEVQYPSNACGASGNQSNCIDLKALRGGPGLVDLSGASMGVLTHGEQVLIIPVRSVKNDAMLKTLVITQDKGRPVLAGTIEPDKGQLKVFELGGALYAVTPVFANDADCCASAHRTVLYTLVDNRLLKTGEFDTNGVFVEWSSDSRASFGPQPGDRDPVAPLPLASNGPADPVTILLVLVGRDGKVLQAWVKQRSGNEAFDRAVLKAGRGSTFRPLENLRWYEIKYEFHPDAPVSNPKH